MSLKIDRVDGLIVLICVNALMVGLTAGFILIGLGLNWEIALGVSLVIDWVIIFLVARTIRKV